MNLKEKQAPAKLAVVKPAEPARVWNDVTPEALILRRIAQQPSKPVAYLARVLGGVIEKLQLADADVLALLDINDLEPDA